MKYIYIKRGLAVVLALAIQPVFSQKVIPKKVNEKPKAVEQNAITDQVFADDLIVQGSACIGLDCVNGESFGFNTLRLKENNLRIRFFDTSSSASFPTRDWELTANSSSNGGGDYFSIDDIDGGRTPFKIEAGARSNALYVDNGGRIGLGTSNPVVELHIPDGDTPTVRLEQDGTSGFTPQTWDMAGNETNFFIRDATNGSTLPFRIRPSAPTSSIDIAGTTGNIGFGTSSPGAAMHVRRTNNQAEMLILEDAGTTDGVGKWLFGVTGPLLKIELDDGNALTNDIKLAIGENNVYVKDAILPHASLPSDRRLKNNIHAFSNAQRTIDLLSPKTFTYDLKAFPDYGFPKGTQYGLIAQEVEEVLPDYVTEVSFPDGKRFKTVNYIGLIPILLQSNKEQQAEIERLKAKISRYEALESRLTALEAKLEEKEVGISVPLKTDEKR